MKSLETLYGGGTYEMSSTFLLILYKTFPVQVLNKYNKLTPTDERFHTLKYSKLYVRKKCESKTFLFKKNWRTEFLFVGTLILMFWTSSDISSGFQSQSV